jgi:hypothetical protein
MPPEHLGGTALAPGRTSRRQARPAESRRLAQATSDRLACHSGLPFRPGSIDTRRGREEQGQARKMTRDPA